MNTYGKQIDSYNYVNSLYVAANSRLMLDLTAAIDIYLTPSPMDGARFGVVDVAGNLATYNAVIRGNGRQIEGASSITLNTNATKTNWFYRGDLGNWVKVTALLASDQSPFPSEFDDYLTTFLALRLNPRYGATSSEEQVEMFKRCGRQLRARYKQTTEVGSEDSLVRLTWRRYQTLPNFNLGR